MLCSYLRNGASVLECYVKAMHIKCPYLHGFCRSPSSDCSGWWFGTWISFFNILGMIIPIDFHIFQRGWNHHLTVEVSYWKWEEQVEEDSNIQQLSPDQQTNCFWGIPMSFHPKLRWAVELPKLLFGVPELQRLKILSDFWTWLGNWI